ncbi:hypothetical protein HAV15_001677 [Penicillium sp. str. |nr:hypothetical protein HAV15_001677 [Penicillium sp. str. \
MSYALESKKRKFHRVLESISKPLTPDSAPKPAPATATTAQDRLSANLSIKKVRLASADRSDLTAVRNSIHRISRPAHRIASANSNKRPTFVPGTANVFSSDVMRVTCVSDCGGAVVVKLPDEIDELDGFNIEKVEERKEVCARLVDEYAKMLSSAHGENCPWRNKSCDATIQHLPLTNCDVALSGLHKRYTNISKMGDKLPAEDIVQTPEGLDLDVLIKGLPDEWFQEAEKAAVSTNGETQPTSTDNQNSTETPKAANRTALALALLGWDTASDGAAGLVGCGACFRRLGLWMYKPKDNGDVTVYTSLNVADEHMEYCPWIDKVAQSGTGRPNEKLTELRAGWQIVTEAVKVKHRRRVRTMASTDTLRTDISTPTETGGEEENPDAKKKADREWWAKIRRVRQVLTAKSPKRKAVLPQ